ncbi:MAG: tetratricopeptide repeat protein [Pseudomonadales bacterium]
MTNSDLSTAQTFTQAVEHHRAGRLQQAQQGYRKVIAANPRHADALHLLGVAELHAGKPDAAIQWISESIAVNAGNADAYLNLGNAYQTLHKTNEAIAAYRQALKLQPGLAPAHSALSNALAKTSALEEAIAAARKAIQYDPNSIDGHKNLGIALHKSGNIEAAIDAYQAAIAFDPSDAELQNNMGHALYVVGRPTDAAEHLLKATELAPQFGPAWFSLGNALKMNGQLQQAAETFLRAVELMPGHVESHIDLAAAYQLAGDFDQALTWLNKALEINPQSAIAHNNMAGVLQRLGRGDEAVAAFQKATELDSSLSDAWGNLALFYEQDNQLDAAQATLAKGLAHAPDDALLNLVAAKRERRAGRPQDAIQRLQRIQDLEIQNTQGDKICFELGRLYDHVDDAERAFASFEQGNELARNKPSARFFANESYRKSIDALQESITLAWYNTWQNVDAEDSRAPVFLVGFPRSGTTLLEQVLDSHPRLATLDEQALVNTLVKKVVQMPQGYPDRLRSFETADVAALREDYWQLANQAISLSAEQILIDKFPLNIIHVPLIHRLFPDAKFILALRHPCDLCLSCYMQEFELNEAMVNFLTLEGAIALYDQVMRLWQQYTQILALDFHVIKYENLVADLEGEARALLQFTGVEWHAAVLEFAEHARQRGKINTPSYHQVTQAIYQDAKYRWHRYSKHVKPFFETLRPHCEAFDYDLEY